MRTLWVDAGAGVAGDMLLAALLDAGADLETVRSAVDTVIPGAVRVESSSVARGGQRARSVDVRLLVTDQPVRSWRSIRDLLLRAALPTVIRDRAASVFERLAVAEAAVHGVPVDDVRFHEVGAWDAIADVVGVSAALHDLGVEGLLTSAVAVGSGTVRTAHGVLPVPAPAVLELVRSTGLSVTTAPDPSATDVGELATPTGVAVLAALSQGQAQGLPTGRVDAVGIGAGHRETPGWPNVVRAVLSSDTPAGLGHDSLVELSANVDDLDPRLWPSVVGALMTAGARDAWLVPVLMKKGRPAHVVHVLADAGSESALADLLLTHTTTLGVRSQAVSRVSLQRRWIQLSMTVHDVVGEVRVKVGHRDGVIVQATPEYDDVAAWADRAGVTEREALARSAAAAGAAGLLPGEPVPGD